jgi:hypothetical protein
VDDCQWKRIDLEQKERTLHQSLAIEVARSQKKPEVVSLLERFFVNPPQTRLEIRKELNITGKVLPGLF